MRCAAQHVRPLSIDARCGAEHADRVRPQPEGVSGFPLGGSTGLSVVARRSEADHTTGECALPVTARDAFPVRDVVASAREVMYPFIACREQALRWRGWRRRRPRPRCALPAA